MVWFASIIHGFPLSNHLGRRIHTFKGHYFIEQYTRDIKNVIHSLQEESEGGVKGYKKTIERWLQNGSIEVDDVQKREILGSMFSNSRVALVYGAAGTGKSTLINYVSHIFRKYSKLFLTQTNPAKANLERRVTCQRNAKFRTIAKQLLQGECSVDLLIVDESSVVSNADMWQVLQCVDFKLLLVVGDVFQIEAIQFGNWFRVAKEFMPDYTIFELTKTYRTSDGSLVDFWQRVRELSGDIEEAVAHGGYSSKFDDSLFERCAPDEVILCLNYDGLYGINNINRFLQAENPHKEFRWGAATYKVGDPVVFGPSVQFRPLIYNNLKGVIVRIASCSEWIEFDIKLDATFNEPDVEKIDDLIFVDHSTVRFRMCWPGEGKSRLSRERPVVPFQVSYAVSIHRAQGLEFDSVKIVLTEANEDKVSHGVFYTAVTRSREDLRIYWSPETERAVLSQLQHVYNKKDVALLRHKFSL